MAKNYYDYDDFEYRGIRDIKNLYDYIDEDHYKPIRINNAFENNYIEYDSNGDINKNLSIEDYLDVIRPYLINMINNHKNEWKIQLSMRAIFAPSKDLGEDGRFMNINSNNIEITGGGITDEIIEELFESLLYTKRIRRKDG